MMHCGIYGHTYIFAANLHVTNVHTYFCSNSWHTFATTHNTHTYIISNLWQTYIYLQQLMTHIHYICMWETCIHIFAATHDTCIYLQQLMTPKLKWRHVSLAVENKHWPSYPTQYNRAITPKASFTSLSLIYTLDSQSCIKYAVKSYRGN